MTPKKNPPQVHDFKPEICPKPIICQKFPFVQSSGWCTNVKTLRCSPQTAKAGVPRQQLLHLGRTFSRNQKGTRGAKGTNEPLVYLGGCLGDVLDFKLPLPSYVEIIRKHHKDPY